jgi:hypothetical protein
MMPMHLVGASSQNKPWWGPKPLCAMVAAKNKKVFVQEAAFFLVQFYVGYGRTGCHAQKYILN